MDSELVIGLVGAIGSDLAGVETGLIDALSDVGYTAETIRVVDLLHQFELWANLPHSPEDQRYKRHIEAGREFCEKLGREDALARLAVASVRQCRIKQTGDFKTPPSRHAYVLRSCKRKAEVELLRKVYGSSFWLVAAYSPRQQRIDDLAKRFAESYNEFDSDQYRALAEKFVEVDEMEGIAFGQDIRSTFPLADVFVTTESRRAIRDAITRFIEILFGYPFHTPTRDEFGMMHARVSALRSSDLSRQVGAAIASGDGDLMCVGTNEVPAFGGGPYWPDTPADSRDFQKGRDTSFDLRRRLLADALRRFQKADWLSEKLDTTNIEELVQSSLEGRSGAPMRESRLMDVIEFGRTVHAEMDAISSAAKRGVSVAGSTLHVTTFPCHICARHIVSAGIKRVVYIEPYHKSLASDLFSDSITVDDPRRPARFVHFEHFVGISPSRYSELFTMLKRKESTGASIMWDKAASVPRITQDAVHYVHNENLLLTEFTRDLSQAGVHELEKTKDTKTKARKK